MVDWIGPYFKPIYISIITSIAILENSSWKSQVYLSCSQWHLIKSLLEHNPSRTVGIKAELVLGLPSSVPGDLVPPALCLVIGFPFRVTGKLSVLNLMVGWESLAQMSNNFKTFIYWVSVSGWVWV